MNQKLPRYRQLQVEEMQMSQKSLGENFRGTLNKFPDFFRTGTFIDSTHMKLKSPSKYTPRTAMHLLYYFNNFWKTPWRSSSVSVSVTFVTASFISSIVS